MWEILVPTEKRVKTKPPGPGVGHLYSDGYPGELERWRKRNSYTTRYHRVWDGKVREITGGLTIAAPVKGEWVSPEGDLFRERMIPVRIVATRDQISEVVKMTMEYYDQLAVLCYKLSDEVLLVNRA
jgi:hypothetical protein